MSLPQKYSKKDKDKLTGKHFGELFCSRRSEREKPAVPCRHTTLLFHQHMHSPKPWSMGVCILNHKYGLDSLSPALSYIA